MTEIRRLKLPIDEATIRSLDAGDFVELDGDIVLTAGLPTCGRILEYMKENRPLPIDIAGGTLFHLGSYSRDTPQGFEVLYINPTTSTRFNAVTSNGLAKMVETCIRAASARSSVRVSRMKPLAD